MNINTGDVGDYMMSLTVYLWKTILIVSRFINQQKHGALDYITIELASYYGVETEIF